jgi:hypothetical protein
MNTLELVVFSIDISSGTELQNKKVVADSYWSFDYKSRPDLLQAALLNAIDWWWHNKIATYLPAR